MAYTKVSTIVTNNSNSDAVNGNAIGWKYFYETFLPTVGWTVTLCADNSATAPSAVNQSHWYFLKKTLTFTDGTTDTISLAYKFEPTTEDLHVYSWDGVLATNDSGDANYGRGSIDFVNDTTNYIMQRATTNVYDIWKDTDSDSWFWIKNGRCIGCWFPDGGWVRQDFVHGGEYIARHVIPYPGFDEGGRMARYYNGNWAIQTSYPISRLDENKTSNYVSLDVNGYAMWRGTSSNIITRASRAQVETNYVNYTKTYKLGSNYYVGMTPIDGKIGIHFNVGSTNPEY